MLKSTHRSAGLQPSTSLPEGWTEHKAPSGHTYYYNKTTKQSTYTRPALESAAPEQDEEPLFAEEAGPDPFMQAALRAQEDFARNTTQAGHFTGGKSYQQRPRRGHGGDRPKKKAAIPDCAPWLLVTTKFGRRFVHNTETKQSLWKFPQDVMMAVIAMDKIEWEKKQKKDVDQPTEAAATNGSAGKTTNANQLMQPEPANEQPQHDFDSSEYEEVEVTDDEDPSSEQQSKRPRLSASPRPNAPPAGPAELTEDDIAYQLAAMEAEYSDDNEHYPRSNPDSDDPDLDDPDGDDDDQGLPLTETDQLALFRSLLDSTHTSPYTTFDSLLTLPQLVEDPRWLSLPNMSSRRDAFTSWSRDRVAELAALKAAAAEQHQQADPADSDPKVLYLQFLSVTASTKLYWPEFKRKFKKEAQMRAYEPSEKEKEKVYREFVGKLKGVEVGRRGKELAGLLKDVGRDEEVPDRVPLKVKRDVRYWVVGEKERGEVVRAWLG